MGRVAAAEVMHNVHQFLGDHLQTGLEFQGFFIFGDVPAEGVVFAIEAMIDAAVGLPADAGRRHEFAIGGNRVFALALEPRIACQQFLPALHGHGSSSWCKVMEGLWGREGGVKERLLHRSRQSALK